MKNHTGKFARIVSGMKSSAATIKTLLSSMVFNESMRPQSCQKRKLFPTGDSAKKVIYLAILAASHKWTMPIHNWKQTLNRFTPSFENEKQREPHYKTD